jgi:DNA-binding NarL/FixJ family response regulator
MSTDCDREARRRVVIVEDHPIVREGLVQVISRQPDLDVVGEAANTRAALSVVRDAKPELVLVDLSLGKEGGLELIKVLAASYPKVATMVLSMHDENIFAERALRAGARGYVTKEEATDVLLAAMRKVLDGEMWFSSRTSSLLLRRFVAGEKPSPTPQISTLTDREIEVLSLLGAGVGTRSMAERMRVSVKTIESHRAHIKEKLGIQTANELVVFAVRWAVEHPAETSV